MQRHEAIIGFQDGGSEIPGGHGPARRQPAPCAGCVRASAHPRMTIPADILSVRQRLALGVIEPLLMAAGGPAPDMRKVTITKHTIVEQPSYDAITRTILEHDMPSIAGRALLDHYTGLAAFRGIMASRELRLAPVARRLDEGELGPFALEHGLAGFVDARRRITETLRAASRNLFYTSFTDPTSNADLWETFGDRGNGYRLA